MEHSCHKNDSIHCTVSNCRHHCGQADYCSLTCVSIGTHEVNPTQPQCVDCESFEQK